jgi:Tfp pilus assembly pilus retraction ATPase PilT
MSVNVEELFSFTDLYIVMEDWESSYCYYPKKQKDIKQNNPPKLITEEQKPFIKKMIRAYQKRKLEILRKEKKISNDIADKLFEDLYPNTILKEELLENTSIEEGKANNLLKKIDIEYGIKKQITRNIEKYIAEENLFNNYSIVDMSFTFMGRHFRTYEMNARNGIQIVCRQTFSKERKLSQTGINPEILQHLCSKDLNEGGLIILCGSNGSGKSTTCAALLKERLLRFGGYCITVEDPIEIPLEGQHGDGRCVQLEINHNEGFAPKIREIMRAYPTGQNLMMLIGEIRDAETASQALRSAIDGRLVITTIHSDNIQSALKRLIVLASDVLTEEGAKDLLSNSFRIGIHQNLKTGKLETQFLMGSQETSNLIKRGDIDKISSELERQNKCLELKKPIN